MWAHSNSGIMDSCSVDDENYDDDVADNNDDNGDILDDDVQGDVLKDRS